MADLPPWARELAVLYESGAHSQFVLHGNVSDTFFLPRGGAGRTGELGAFLGAALLSAFEVILFYDLGRGLRAERGGEHVERWPSFEKRGGRYPSKPAEAVGFVDHFLRYCTQLRRVNGQHLRVAVVFQDASLIVPVVGYGVNHELSALAIQIRNWSSDLAFHEHGIATFLITENLNDLNPLLANNPRAAQVEVPLPGDAEMLGALEAWRAEYPRALERFGDLAAPAAHLAGTTLGAVAGLLRRRQHQGRPLEPGDLSELKKELVEKECHGLIDFIEPDRTLDDLHGLDAVKQWLRQDIVLWQQGDLKAMPMGYLFCGPVGTGKTYLAHCLAGEAGVPVVRLKNFRDRWVGSTEGNLEKIFRLLHALGRCIVFIDEADQALGRRTGGDGDSGVSGRVYSMMAEEMSRPSNRGHILWILASSRPDLIEVDLKRPGRIDIKIPIFPAANDEESFGLIAALCRRYGVAVGPEERASLAGLLPRHVTPGAAEALAVKVYRMTRVRGIPAAEALRECLDEYQNPVPPETMDFQIELAVREASDLSFVPDVFRR